jgi:hypothetical protein
MLSANEQEKPALADGTRTGALDPDLERNEDHQFLMNRSVRNFSWKGLTVTVKDRQTKNARDLINDISGDVQQGAIGIKLNRPRYRN